MSDESQRRLEAERRLTKDRWEAFELIEKSIDQADVQAWAASLNNSEEKAE